MSDIAEFVVDIDGDLNSTLRLHVNATSIAAIDDELERTLPTFPSADLDQLRSGEASEGVAEALSIAVTTWLLQNDLRGHLGTAFNAATAPFRIVIRPHLKVLPYLADVPFELLKFGGDRLVLLHNVRAIVHSPKTHRGVATPLARSGWPLRILLVRSNPANLGSQVPPIQPLANNIRSLADQSGFGKVVEVKVLSSELEGSGAVTYDSLRRELEEDKDGGYNVLVYLGHGDLPDAGFEDLAPMGVLQFELEGSPYPHPVRADQLTSELQHHPVPLVLLAGCVTAASNASVQRLPQWIRGSQSVAGALVFLGSGVQGAGVQCAIGMRYRLDTDDANRFLLAFFQSLFDQRYAGDVEQAVQKGRLNLFAKQPYPPSWSAPVVFRVDCAEPMFPWLGQAPRLSDPLEEPLQQYRQTVWRVQSTTPGDGRGAGRQILAAFEEDFVSRWTSGGTAVIWPAQIEMKPNGSACVSIQESGALKVSCLEGRLTFPKALVVQAMRPSVALLAAGFELMNVVQDQPGQATFVLRQPNRTRAVLPQGPLFEVDMALPQDAPAVYLLSVDGLISVPPMPMREWNNAIVVPPPPVGVGVL